MSPSEYPFVILDVFTSTAFAGNQLALVRLPHKHAISREQRHAIAREFNFSETVFLYDPPPTTGSAASIDSVESRTMEIWTPDTELPFAGHPTIGTAVYCGTEFSLRDFQLQQLAGPVTANYDPQSAMATALIAHNVRTHACTITPDQIFKSQPQLKAFVIGTGDPDVRLKTSIPIVSIVKGMTFALVELPTVEEHLSRVQATALDLEGVELDEGWETKIFSSYFYVLLPPSKDQPDVTHFRTRMVFGDGEDAATGSAACTLSVYCSLQRGGANAKYTFMIEQGVEMGRRSVIHVSVKLDRSGQAVESVQLAGTAVVTMHGHLTA